ncbi:MAG TPA: hypothetical protein VJ811_12285 [Sphingopyxis sp.]|nr:hypothetical protein [Sphingopyxis sp.]
MRTPETFAIGAMCDHVLDAASLRLDPMTAGRYRFEWGIESVGGRTRRGLDIRVHDIETGWPREISTLSGGETLIAALSLALGLSDIVEMNHGRICLDTENTAARLISCYRSERRVTSFHWVARETAHSCSATALL